MSITHNVSNRATLAFFVRLVRMPLLGGIIGAIIATALLALIKYGAQVIGNYQYVPAAVPLIVLIAYTITGAILTSVFFPEKP